MARAVIKGLVLALVMLGFVVARAQALVDCANKQVVNSNGTFGATFDPTETHWTLYTTNSSKLLSAYPFDVDEYTDPYPCQVNTGFSYEWKVDGVLYTNTATYNFSRSTSGTYSVVCTVNDPPTPTLGDDTNVVSKTWTIDVIKRTDWDHDDKSTPEDTTSHDYGDGWAGITSPTVTCVDSGSPVQLSCEELTDYDTKVTYDTSGVGTLTRVQQTVNHKWEISFEGRNGHDTQTLSGPSVSWNPPKYSVSDVTITCKPEDSPTQPPSGDTGEVDDPDPTSTIHVKVMGKNGKDWNTGAGATLSVSGGPTMCKEGESVTIYATATDSDNWVACGSQSGTEPDSFQNWRWSVVSGPGSIRPNGDGTAVYTGPLPGTLTTDTADVAVQVSVDDVGHKEINDLGSRDDTITPVTIYFTVTRLQRVWDTGTTSGTGSNMVVNITAPSDGAKVSPGQKVTCSADAIDSDRWTLGATQGTSNDVIKSYTWHASAGSFVSNVTAGPSATWIAPSQPGSVSISVDADDLGIVPPGDTGTREHGSGSSTSVSVTVVGKDWSATPDIDVSLPNPVTNGKVKSGEKVYFEATASDLDTWTQSPNQGTEADSIISYSWSGGGTFDGSGAKVTWTAPNVTQNTDYTIGVQVDDQGTLPNGDTGSRDDGPKSASTTIHVTNTNRTWDVGTPASVKITSPADGALIKGGSGAQSISLSADSEDQDHWIAGSDEAYAADGVDLTWSADGGSVTGSTWDPSSASGEVTISVTGVDQAIIPNGDDGTRDDDDATDSITVTVDSEEPYVSVEVPSAVVISDVKWVPARFMASVTASDNSGIASISCDPPGYSQPVSSQDSAPVTGWFDISGQEDGDTVTIDGEATDNVGNVGNGSTEVKVDAVAPTSSASAPSESSSLTFTVTWSGSDNTGGSGLKDYDVEYKVDDGEWQGWQSATTATSAEFTGDNGHTYYFRSIARDNVDNKEAVSGSDTSCTVGDDEPPTSQVDSLPASVAATTITVTWSGKDNPDPGGVGIASYDVQVGELVGETVQWTDWQSAVTGTSASFTGTVGHTYYFQCRARDLAGNLESYPGGTGDAHCTLVSSGGGGGGPSLSIAASGDYIVPGCPLNTVDFTVGSSGADDVTFEVLDNGGTVVRSESFGSTQPGSHRYQWDGLDENDEDLAMSASPYKIRMSATIGSASSGWSVNDNRKVEAWALEVVIGDQPVENETLVSGVDESTITADTFSVTGTFVDGGMPPALLPIVRIDPGVEDPDGPEGNHWDADVWLDAVLYTTPSTPVDIRYQLRLEETGDLVRDYVLNPWDMDPTDDDLDTIGILSFGIDSQDEEAELRDLAQEYEPAE